MQDAMGVSAPTGDSALLTWQNAAPPVEGQCPTGSGAPRPSPGLTFLGHRHISAVSSPVCLYVIPALPPTHICSGEGGTVVTNGRLDLMRNIREGFPEEAMLKDLKDEQETAWEIREGTMFEAVRPACS